MKKADENKKTKKTMKFGTRIAISFFAIVIVPVAIIILLFLFTLKYRMEYYGLDADEGAESIYNNALMLSRLTDDTYEKLKELATDQSEKLEDKQYLDFLNAQLGTEYAFLVVRIDNEIIYMGSNDFSMERLKRMLPAYDNEITSKENWTNILTRDQTMIRQVDFISATGEKSGAFIIIDMNNLYPGLKRWISDLLVSSLIVFIATALIVTLWLYLGISKPLQTLKKATRSIRDGNLDFSVKTDSRIGEIEELCVDFEEMRKKLKDSQEEKMSFDSENNELIRNISHDLKTPITAVKGYCEGIIDGIADTPEKLKKYVRTIYNKTTEMDRLINELTYYSKIDTNRMPYTFTKINAKEYFNDCREELELELERERVEFSYTDDLKEDTLIIADAEQLRRVIHNIINNSVKYMDKPKRIINMRVSDKDDFISIEIEDNGKGIAKKDQTKVFDRFYRTDASRNSTRGGSGIGLSIVRKILEDHGGKVWAKGEEGKGTVICFILRKYQEVSYNE